ncbi:MAG: hypothetical protein U0840_03105 [Gemmataceae bacterium]
MPWLLFGVLLAPDPAWTTPKTITLGGPRRVVVRIALEGDYYTLRTRMLAVRCFDEATNARLNQQMARMLSLGGLAQALSEKKPMQLTVQQVKVIGHDVDGAYFTLQLRVPRDGVALVEGKKTVSSERTSRFETIPSVDAFLNRVKDHEATLTELMTCLRDDLAEAVARHRRNPDDETLLLAIAQLEERCFDNLQRYAKVIGDDALLLSIERDELVRTIGRHKKEFLVALKRAVPPEKKP